MEDCLIGDEELDNCKFSLVVITEDFTSFISESEHWASFTSEGSSTESDILGTEFKTILVLSSNISCQALRTFCVIELCSDSSERPIVAPEFV